MIVKRIRKGARQARGSIARVAASVTVLSSYVVDANPWAMAEFERVRSLTGYALHIDSNKIEPGEKVESFGTFNLHGQGLWLWQMQLAAIAMRAPRSRDPIEHFVFSWPEHEHPTAKQVEDAAEILLDVLGYKNCPAIWSQHGNTRNDHGHLAVVRVDPTTGQIASDGWDIDRAHQAIALIEERQGWASEPNALYVAHGGEVFDRLTGAKVRDAVGRQLERNRIKRLPPMLEAKAIEIRQTVAGAENWGDLHARMAARRAAYRRKGSGAVIDFNDEQIKASAFHPGCSLAQLEKRLGPFQPDLSLSVRGYETYRDACRQQLAQIRHAHQAERAALKSWLDAAVNAANPLLASAMRAEYSSALASLDAAFAGAKKAFSSAQLSEAGWRRGGQPTGPVAIPIPTLMLPSPGTAERRTFAPAELWSRQRGWKTDYYDADQKLVITDLRSIILVHQPSSSNLDAALRLAAQRWGSVRIRARRDVMELAAERAAMLGIRLIDHDGRVLSSRSRTVNPSDRAKHGVAGAQPKSTRSSKPSDPAPKVQPPSPVVSEGPVSSPPPSEGPSLAVQQAWHNRGRGR